MEVLRPCQFVRNRYCTVFFESSIRELKQAFDLSTTTRLQKKKNWKKIPKMVHANWLEDGPLSFYLLCAAAGCAVTAKRR